MDKTELGIWLNKNVTSFSSSKILKLAPGAFSNQSDLTSINLPNVTILPPYAFYECYNLTQFITGKLTRLGDFSLTGCYLIPSLDVSGVKYLGRNVFGGNHLTELKVLDFKNLETMSYNCFWKSTFEKIWLPSTCVIIGENFHEKASEVDTVIYTDATEKPSSWDNEWNYCGHTVMWGSTHEEFENA